MPLSLANTPSRLPKSNPQGRQQGWKDLGMRRPRFDGILKWKMWWVKVPVRAACFWILMMEDQRSAGIQTVLVVESVTKPPFDTSWEVNDLWKVNETHRNNIRASPSIPFFAHKAILWHWESTTVGVMWTRWELFSADVTLPEDKSSCAVGMLFLSKEGISYRSRVFRK